MKPSAQVSPTRGSINSERLDELKKQAEASQQAHVESLWRLFSNQTEISNRYLEKLLEARRDQQQLAQRSSFMTGVLLGQVVMLILAFTTLRLAKLK